MPLTRSESIGLGIGVLNIWDRHVNAHSMRQFELIMNQYVDDNVIAYVRKESDGVGIRVVKLEEFKCLRKSGNIINIK